VRTRMRSAFEGLPTTRVFDVPMRRQHIIKPSRGLPSLDLGTLWEYRELLYFLVWRDVKVRYKQTALGIMWIVLQPVVSMMIFTVLFGILLQVPSEEAPYPVFVLSALIPWNYFASSLNRSSTSLVYSSNLVTKVYFPRMLIPLSGVLSGLIDLVIASVLLLILMVAYRISPTPAAIFLPGLVLLASATALGFGLWLSALNVRYRDVRNVVPFLVQIWMYISVIVPFSELPERWGVWRYLYGLNPMAGIIEMFRWCLLHPYMTPAPVPAPMNLLLVGMPVAALLLVGGLFCFRRFENQFADVV